MLKGVSVGSTIKDVAKKANVSVTTVSRWLHGNIKLPETTEERIKKAIEDLDYKPNLIARSMISRKSETIALVIPNITTPLFVEIAKGIQAVANANNFKVFLCDTGEDYQQEEFFIDELEARYIDGYIFAGVSMNKDGYYQNNKISKKIENIKKPVVFINRKRHDMENVFEISHDSKAGTEMLVKHFLSLGHKKIGLVSGPSNIPGVQEANNAFLEILKKEDIVEGDFLIKEGDLKIEGGERALNQLLEKIPGLTCVLTFSELMAGGALNLLREKNLVVPKDFSVATLDKTFLSQVIHPALTAAYFNPHETGKEAMRKLLDSFQGKPPKEKIMKIKPQFVLGNSTKTCFS